MSDEDNDIRITARGKNRFLSIPSFFLVFNIVVLMCTLLLGWGLTDYTHRIAPSLRYSASALISLLPIANIFGIVGAVIVSSAYKNGSSRGAARAGLWLSLVYIPVYFYCVMTSPVMLRAKGRMGICFSNVKHIGLALNMYADDYDNRFPPRNTWNEALVPYIQSGGSADEVRRAFHCPDAPNTDLPMLRDQQVSDHSTPGRPEVSSENPGGIRFRSRQEYVRRLVDQSDGSFPS